MAKNIMLQGTMSNVGKSFLTAALCRIFSQDGYKVAPFKSQNMALNSYITFAGEEIGRAQALQAEAAGIAPTAYMNPILLKPTTDIGSQVIVNGKVRGNMRAADYFKYKKELIPDIIAAYKKLESEYDIIVIEGAGSPVELNLKKDDIVNMGLAQLVKSPVLLVGDIDRGGVFAQLIGTLALLEKNEKEFVKGLIVNQFRGDISLFSDGVKILEEKSKKSVLGVIPYIETLLEDEDSLSGKFNNKSGEHDIEISVIKLPKISNFSDFDVFMQYSGVFVNFVTKPSQLVSPDMIIIPGTKSTITDLKWLRESGLEEKIKKFAANEVPVFGICGGYQMLGTSIDDTVGCESGGVIEGMGLLDHKTIFCTEKKQCQVNGKFDKIVDFYSFLSDAEYYGYEVHMGSTISNCSRLLQQGGGYSHNIAGCYVHGLFDSSDVSGRLIKELFRRKGLQYNGDIIDRKKFREQQLDLIADIVRKNIDMSAVYRIIEEGV